MCLTILWSFTRTSSENLADTWFFLKDNRTAVKMKLTGILVEQNAIRPEWFGFDNVVEYKLDNPVQP